MLKSIVRAALTAATMSLATLVVTPSASATVFIVDAFANSSSGGTGVATFNVTAGEPFRVSVNPLDLWNAGPLPRWSNANGLTGNLLATGLDDSLDAPGTLIGVVFPLWTQDGLTAPYGSLVGEIGGVFKFLGTSFNGPAWASGTLTLYYWDSNFEDNTQFISADVGVDAPSVLSIVAAGLFSLAELMMWRRRFS